MQGLQGPLHRGFGLLEMGGKLAHAHRLQVGNRFQNH
jgi:hypothetical protein